MAPVNPIQPGAPNAATTIPGAQGTQVFPNNGLTLTQDQQAAEAIYEMAASQIATMSLISKGATNQLQPGEGVGTRAKGDSTDQEDKEAWPS